MVLGQVLQPRKYIFVSGQELIKDKITSDLENIHFYT